MGVPDLQSAQDVSGARRREPGVPLGPSAAPGASAGLGGRTQQRAALLEHPVVVGTYPGEPGRPGHQQLVEEAAPLRRVALDQRQVLGREQHRAQQADDVPRPGHRRAVEPGAVGPARVDLQLDQRAPVVPLTTAQRTTARAAPCRTSGASVATRWLASASPRSPGLDQVGLALAVGPDEGRDPRLQAELHGCVGPEVGQREMGDVHPTKVSAPRASPGQPAHTLWKTRVTRASARSDGRRRPARRRPSRPSPRRR